MPAATLEVENLCTYFHQTGEVDGRLNKAIDGVTFTLREGETLGVVGRTGSGKSVLARSIMGLVAEPGFVAGGSIRFRGQELVGLPDEKYNTLRGSEIALI